MLVKPKAQPCHFRLYVNQAVASILTLPIFCMPTDASADSIRIYYGSSSSLKGYLSYVEPATGDITQVYSGPSAGRPVVPAVQGNSLYWSTYYPGLINRSDLEGNGLETLVDQGHSTTRAIEFYGSNVYWSNETYGSIYRALPDFSVVEEVISGHLGYDGGIWDFAMQDGRFYWTSWDSAAVRTTNLDGTDLQTIYPGGVRSGQRIFSLEIANDRLFLSDTHNDRIVSTALDGSDLHVLVDAVEAQGIAIFNERLYYNDAAGDGRNLYSVPLGGGTPRYEATTDRRSFQLTVIPEPSTFVLAIVGLALAGSRLRYRRDQSLTL
jgi:hypothetical protein